MNDQTFHYVIRVPKEHSAFIYFQLESSEGICFYSTLTSSLGKGYRDLELKGHVSLQDEADQLLEQLSHKLPIEFLKK